MKKYVKSFFLFSLAIILSNNVSAMRPRKRRGGFSGAFANKIIELGDVPRYFADLDCGEAECLICSTVIANKRNHLATHKIFVNHAMPQKSKLVTFLESLNFVKVFSKTSWKCLLCDKGYESIYSNSVGHLLSAHGIEIKRKKTERGLSFYHYVERPGARPSRGKKFSFDHYADFGHIKCDGGGRGCTIDMNGKFPCSYCEKLCLAKSLKRHMLRHRVDISKPIQEQDFTSLEDIKDSVRLRFESPMQVAAPVVPRVPVIRPVDGSRLPVPFIAPAQAEVPVVSIPADSWGHVREPIVLPSSAVFAVVGQQPQIILPVEFTGSSSEIDFVDTFEMPEQAAMPGTRQSALAALSLAATLPVHGQVLSPIRRGSSDSSGSSPVQLPSLSDILSGKKRDRSDTGHGSVGPECRERSAKRRKRR